MKKGGESIVVETIKHKLLNEKEIFDILQHNSQKDNIIYSFKNKGLKDIDFYNFHELFDISHLKNPLKMNSATVILLVYIICIAIKIPYICNKKKNTDEKCNIKTIFIDIVFDTLIFMTVYYIDSCLTSDYGFKCQGISNMSILIFISLLIWKIYHLEHHKYYFIPIN